jgi:hypothetical protein
MLKCFVYCFSFEGIKPRGYPVRSTVYANTLGAFSWQLNDDRPVAPASEGRGVLRGVGDFPVKYPVHLFNYSFK